MTVLHTGSTKKYSANWDTIFSDEKQRGSSPKRGKPAKRSARPAPGGRKVAKTTGAKRTKR